MRNLSGEHQEIVLVLGGDGDTLGSQLGRQAGHVSLELQPLHQRAVARSAPLVILGLVRFSLYHSVLRLERFS
jgi:hypothetical protein